MAALCAVTTHSSRRPPMQALLVIASILVVLDFMAQARPDEL